MGRYDGNEPYNHRCWKEMGDYVVSYTKDHYKKGVVFRMPKVTTKYVNKATAERFCKKHGLTMP